MKRVLALLFVLLIAAASTASAAKARSINSDAASDYHASHLAWHIGETTCRATGNYIKAHAQSDWNQIVGHLEQADAFELIEIRNGYALISVTFSHHTSPDSFVGMTGFVNADYIDCTCSAKEYANPAARPTGGSTASLQDCIGTNSVLCTGSNLRIRNAPNGKTILGHLQKADTFTLLALKDGWAQIIVTEAAPTSPDSYQGLLGWVSADYIRPKRASAAPAPSGDAWNGYGSVLDMFYRAIVEEWDEEKLAAAGFEPYEFPERLIECRFSFRDINADGVREMLIFRDSDAEIGSLLAGYTLSKGQPVRIFSSWARNRYLLRSDGSIFNAGSNGAAYSVYYLLDLVGSELVVREGVLSGDYEEDGETRYGWFLVDERADFTYAEHTRISEDEAEQRIAQYQSAVLYDLSNFTTFAEYASSL